MTASLARRLASLVYELFLLAGIWLSLVLFPQVAIASAIGAAAPGWLLWLHTLAILGALYGWLWTKGRRTLAMKTWKLRLTTDRGDDLEAAHAAMRFIWAWPSYGLCGIGIFWALIDPDGKFLHDRLAKTRIVSDPTPS